MTLVLADIQTLPAKRFRIKIKNVTAYLLLFEETLTFASAIYRKANALLAQLVEQLTLNQWVQGSSP